MTSPKLSLDVEMLENDAGHDVSPLTADEQEMEKRLVRNLHARVNLMF